LSSITRVYEMSDDMFWWYFKAFIDDADRRLDTQDGAYLRKWIDPDTHLKISILDRVLVMDAIIQPLIITRKPKTKKPTES
jgi:hypothetical protein